MFTLAPHASIVILTGAGISRESGIETFRDTDGIWQRYSLEDVCTPQGFERNPELVHGFYNDRRKQLLNQAIAPNSAHIALVELEWKWPGRVTLVTQNIDNLHERAGQENLLHMHGELMRMICRFCNTRHETTTDTSPESICPVCDRADQMRPDIVWFGESPYHLEAIYDALSDADLFVAIGTSGTVYPAAGFAYHASQQGAQLVEINLEPSLQAGHFTYGFYGPATEQVPLFVATLLQEITS